MAGESILHSLEQKGHSAPRLQLRSATGDSAPEPPLPRLKESGRYEILGEIAQGGVGIVLKGRDVDLGRDVALKVLRPGHVDNPELLQRFVEEAQIGGQLQHPGIVPVYELGLGRDRRPFFAMKLVKGRTLAALLAERKEPVADRRKFLAIFERVCQTLAYAHTRGVVHRDLKPSNVMIGNFAEVQVVDWGFAKVLAQGGVADERRAARKAPGVTQIATVRSAGEGSDSIPGSVMGTPAYMPPEQALGHVDDLDERSDVFSLGGILCEILTGEPPYTGQDLLVQAAQSRLDGAYGRLEGCAADDELVLLCKRCLSPMRGDRPCDAGALAAAVQGHLASVEERARRSVLAAIKSREKAAQARAHADEERALAVAARRRAEEQRAAAERARERAALAIAEAAAARRAKRQTLALAAAVLLAIGAGAGGWIWIEREAGLRRESAARAVNEAIQEANVLRGGNQWAAAASAAQKARDLARTGGADDETLRRADALFDAVAAEALVFQEALEQQRRDAELLSRLEDIRARAYDDFDHAKTDGEYAAAFREHGIDLEQVPADEAAAWLRSRSNRLDVVAMVDVWARLRREFTKRSRPEWETMVDAAKAADPDEWRSRIRDAGAAGEATALLELASSPEVAAAPALTQSLLEMSLRELGQYDAAVSLLRKAQRRNPGVVWLNENLASALQQATPPHAAEAARFHTAAVALRPRSAGLWNNLATSLNAKEDADGAIAACREAIELNPSYGNAHNGLGVALRRRGDTEKAIESYRSAIRIDPGLVAARVNLANALLSKGAVQEAIAECREATRLHPESAAALSALGMALTQAKDFKGAAGAFEEAIRIDRTHEWAYINYGGLLSNHLQEHARAIEMFREAIRLKPHESMAYCNLGVALRRTGDHPSAAEAFRAAIARKPEFAEAHLFLGSALFDAGDVGGSVTEYREAVRLRPGWAAARNALGVALERKGLGQEAIAEYREATRLDTASLEPRVRLGLALSARGEYVAAVEEYKRAVEIFPDDIVLRYNLGVALELIGKQEEAAAAYREAILRRPDLAEAHCRLGQILFRAGDTDGAFAEYREAIRWKPAFAMAHHGLGVLLWDRKMDFEGAARELREALRLEPANAGTHFVLGQVLEHLADREGAILEYREALRLQPDLGSADFKLGGALMEKALFGEALETLRRASLPGSASEEERASAARLVRICERMVELEPSLDAIAGGRVRPKDAAETLEFARLCQLKRYAAAACRLYRAGLAADARAAEDLGEGHRYDAACCAAVAGCGGGADAARLDEKTRAGLRRQALTWLRADLALRANQIDAGPGEARKAALAALRYSKRDRDLAGVREEAELDELPGKERAEWRALWADVDALIGKAQE